ncbi:conserved hypothetical protein [Rhodospirillaceae bacterium LM-1]|nr:conserved hypothetical protein [Rhodospirillaceae bacterium LM-1]
MSSLVGDFLKRLFLPPPKAVEAKLPDNLELKGAPKPKTMTPERQALIDDALKIYRSKQSLLDELPPIQREALVYMALKTFFNAPIDANAKPGVKKPAKPS